MQPSCNIYQKARNAKGLTQERAAELLGISVRSLADYEAGVRRPPDHVIVDMVDLYENHFMGIKHLREGGELERQIIPDVPVMTFPEAACAYSVWLQKIVDSRANIEFLDIARDGQVSEDERERFVRAIADNEEFMAAIMALRAYMFHGRDSDGSTDTQMAGHFRQEKRYV